jgi:hypothetical protein
VPRLKQDLAIVLLTIVGGGMVAAADLSRSYAPLFIGWLAFAAIPWVVSRMERP